VVVALHLDVVRDLDQYVAGHLRERREVHDLHVVLDGRERDLLEEGRHLRLGGEQGLVLRQSHLVLRLSLLELAQPRRLGQRPGLIVVALESSQLLLRPQPLRAKRAVEVLPEHVHESREQQHEQRHALFLGGVEAQRHQSTTTPNSSR
jgi:hypothetical protein